MTIEVLNNSNRTQNVVSVIMKKSLLINPIRKYLLLVTLVGAKLFKLITLIHISKELLWDYVDGSSLSQVVVWYGVVVIRS